MNFEYNLKEGKVKMVLPNKLRAMSFFMASEVLLRARASRKRPRRMKAMIMAGLSRR